MSFPFICVTGQEPAPVHGCHIALVPRVKRKHTGNQVFREAPDSVPCFCSHKVLNMEFKLDEFPRIDYFWLLGTRDHWSITITLKEPQVKLAGKAISFPSIQKLVIQFDQSLLPSRPKQNDQLLWNLVGIPALISSCSFLDAQPLSSDMTVQKSSMPWLPSDDKILMTTSLLRFVI